MIAADKEETHTHFEKDKAAQENKAKQLALTAPRKLVRAVYEFCLCVRGSLPSTPSKCNALLLKMFEMSKLRVNSLKTQALAYALVAFADNVKLTAMQKYQMSIRRYIAQQKGVPFTARKWLDIVKRNIVAAQDTQDDKSVKALAKYAVDLMQAQWSVQHDLFLIATSEGIAFVLNEEDGDVQDEKQSKRKEEMCALEWILQHAQEQSFGLQPGSKVIPFHSVTFSADRYLVAKYRDSPKHHKLLHQCMKANVLHIETTESLNKRKDTIILTLDQAGNNINAMTLDEMLKRLSDSLQVACLWERAVFESNR